MQPVAHVLEYYETLLCWADAAHWPHVHLRERVQHYRTLNGTWSWTAPNLTKLATHNKLQQHQIPFDPPYRILSEIEQILRKEDAYNKLLEAGAIDEDELNNPEPTALQHYIDRTNNKT